MLLTVFRVVAPFVMRSWISYFLFLAQLHLSDYIGLDTCLYIVKGWVEKYPNEPAFIIPKCLEKMVADGHLGRKTGQGFYKWEGDKRGDPVV
jgi:3-hydroxyacyl-CoA dehydrogenase